MSKILVMCEGANEKKIVDLLLEHNKLRITKDDLLGLVTYHARQITSPVIAPFLTMYSGDIDIIRIGDKQSDSLQIPKNLRKRIKTITKYCTKPELEILLIINEGLYEDYIRHYSRIRPKQYAKNNIIYQKQKYDNSTRFYDNYYSNRIDNLIANLEKYKRLKKHNTDELYLYDLLNFL